MNFIDKAIEYVAPTLAAKRTAARTVLRELANVKQSTSRGAIATRIATPWGSSRSLLGGSSASRRDYGLMRDRARNVYAENHIGSVLLDIETDYVMSDGYTLQLRTNKDDFNKEAPDRWYAWLDKADIAGKLSGGEWFRTSWREPRKDGDGGIVLTSSGAELRLQYVPGDLIGDSFDGRAEAAAKARGNTIQDGVETNPDGRPVAFYCNDEDEFGKSTQTPRVPASDFIYLPHLNSPLEIRGMTCYAKNFERLDQLDGYVDGVAVAARLALVFGLIFKSATGIKELSGLPLETNSSGQTTRALTVENGSLKFAGQKDDVVQVDAKQPMQQTPDFIRAMFRLICHSFKMPLEIGGLDFSTVTFVSGRLGLLSYKRHCRVQQDWIKSRCWNRIYEWWIARERKRQQLGLSEFVSQIPEDAYKYEFIPDEFPVADRLAEAQADILEISIGEKSPQMCAAGNSRDHNEVRRQIKEARDLNDADGIPNVLSTLVKLETEGQPKPEEKPPEPVTQKEPNGEETQNKDG